MSLGNIDTKMLTVVLLRTAKAKGIILFDCLKIFTKKKNLYGLNFYSMNIFTCNL